MKIRNKAFLERCEDWAMSILMVVAVCCIPIVTIIKVLGCIGLGIVALICMIVIFIKIAPIVCYIFFIGVIASTACVVAYAIFYVAICVIGFLCMLLNILWHEIKEWRYIAKIVSAF